jgi:DNA gyrase subunit A
VAGISSIGRATQGVRLIRLKDDDLVASFGRVIHEDDQDVPAEPLADGYDLTPPTAGPSPDEPPTEDPTEEPGDDG